MDENNIPTEHAAALRQQAEALFLERSPQTLATLSPEKAQQLLNELQVHQIELEMQNDEMQRLHLEMEASRARYFGLYDLAPVGYLTVSEAGMILEANLTATRMLGMSRSVLVTHPFTHFIAREDQDSYYLHRAALLETIVPQIFELRMQGHDHQPFWASLAATLATGDSSEREIRIMLTDIGTRKQAEAELRKSLEFSHNLIDSMQDGISVLDPDGLAVDANLALCRMTGFSREELIGVGPPHPYWPPEEHERIFAALDKTLKGKTPYFELTFMRKNGERFPAIVSPSAVTDRDGKILSYAATVRDVSERKRAQEALAAERNLLRSLVDLLPTWIFVKDRESRFLLVNEACASNMGAASPEEMVGKTDVDYYLPEIAADLRREEVGVLAGTPMQNREVCKEMPDGSQRILQIQKVPLRDRDGTITGLVGAGFDITELKTAEKELRASELFQRDILNSLPAHIAVLDPAGVIVEVNEPWLQFARDNGTPPIDKIGVGAKYLEVCHTAWLEGDSYALAAVAGLESVLAGEQTRFALDYPCDSPDCARWFSMEVLHLENAEGAIVAHTDITERKNSEEALRDANQKLRLHFEQTPMAVIEWDLEFRVTRWNPAARTIFGHSREEALGQHASFIVPKAYRHLVDEIWQALLDKSGGERSTNPNVSKDGTPILCEWYNTPLIDERGTVRGVASVVMDITERTQALQLLAWEKSALESINSSAPLAMVLNGLMLGLEEQLPGALCSVLLLDTDGIHLRTGAAPSLPEDYNLAVDGIAIGPMIGSCGTAAFLKRQVIVADIASDPLWAAYREVAAHYDLHACWSTPILCGEGNVLGTFAIYYRETGSPAVHELDLIERAVHVVRIAIERKRAEEEILLLNASLEQRVQERTEELQAANEELEAFTYSVSHDLRAPLRAVDGFSRMVIEDCAADLDADGLRMLGVIRSETQRMGRLIDDLLEFSRLGRLPIESLPIDMHRLAQESYDELVAREPERKFQLDLHPLALAYGSEALIRQVWVNLLSNALKFTREREICEIEIGSQQGENGETIYYVKDNGSGFDMRHSSKLFGIFQRLHSQEEFSGTGVGLALVQRIVQRHGGSIRAESELNRGAAFYLTLPNHKP